MKDRSFQSIKWILLAAITSSSINAGRHAEAFLLSTATHVPSASRTAPLHALSHLSRPHPPSPPVRRGPAHRYAHLCSVSPLKPRWTHLLGQENGNGCACVSYVWARRTCVLTSGAHKTDGEGEAEAEGEGE
ncbi:unnamed protein product, partial [Discosporangium mesarthrocarpum]